MPKTPKMPHEVAAIKKEIEHFLNATDTNGKRPSNARCGVYVFYDYDGEPIYVGQTQERLRVRIRRHLTNQRTDAVAMNVLDPFEVAEIEVYPFYDLEELTQDELENELKDASKEQKKAFLQEKIKQTLAAAEYTVFQKVLRESALGAVLNEKTIAEQPLINLPQSFRGRIIPDDIYALRKHPDVRIARRATTVANLARVISERDVSMGLRQTLITQAQRLERLARQRLDEMNGSYPIEEPGEETGETETT